MKARRSMIPGISLMAGLPAWLKLHEPGSWEGLIFLALLMVLILPTLLLLVAFGVPYFTAGLIPREWRARYRQGSDRNSQRSSRIPAWLRRCVLAADRRRCVHCRSEVQLQIDHGIPWSLGGLTALFNLFTLCARCNRIKSNYWVRRNGTVCYKPFAGADHMALAAAIARSEQRHRINPLRWVRAAYSLGWI